MPQPDTHSASTLMQVVLLLRTWELQIYEHFPQRIWKLSPQSCRDPDHLLDIFTRSEQAK